MSVFNKKSRTSNVIYSSLISTICNLINMIMGFVYRTVFLYILSATYLGINGLFSNILQILSLADLGIFSAVSFRFYKPISENDVNKVGELMKFFKKVYLIIAFIIFIFGVILFPFIGIFIRNDTSLPSDINLNVIYFLYLFQTISTYVCSYKQILLSADQKQHVFSILQTGLKFANNIVQILILFITRNFTYSLFSSIVTTVIINLIINYWITQQYKEVFLVQSRLSKKEVNEIINDTKATMCHKVGGTVLSSTDNIILSSFVNLTATGLYSNYSLVITSLSAILTQLLGSFTASFGNARLELSNEQNYLTYRKMLFINFWIAGLTTVCLYCLIDKFLTIWLGDNMLLSSLTVCALSIQFYLDIIRKINTSYTNACGLFVRDRIRPLIEASINLIVSIILVLYIGIPGVFFGTVISNLCTVFWREPYILYKYEFKKPMKEFWMECLKFTLITIAVAYFVQFMFNYLLIFPLNIITWIIYGIIAASMYILFTFILLSRNQYFIFFKNFLILKAKVFLKK